MTQLDDAFGFIRASEQVGAQMRIAMLIADELGRIGEGEPFVAPEMTAAIDALAEAVAAMSRGVNALRTRFDVRWNTTKGSDQDE